MNAGVIVCSVTCTFFLLLAFLFTILKGKASMLISGFDLIPKEKRNLYDLEKLSKDYRNEFLIWSLILGIGAVLSYFISQYVAIVAYIIWLIVLFKNVHFDEEKAFGKYKKKS